MATPKSHICVGVDNMVSTKVNIGPREEEPIEEGVSISALIMMSHLVRHQQQGPKGSHLRLQRTGRTGPFELRRQQLQKYCSAVSRKIDGNAQKNKENR